MTVHSQIKIELARLIMLMMRKMSVMVVVLLVLCVMASNVEQSFAQVDCYDGCSTACVQYASDPRLMSRCDRKCQIKCGADSQVEKNSN